LRICPVRMIPMKCSTRARRLASGCPTLPGWRGGSGTGEPCQDGRSRHPHPPETAGAGVGFGDVESLVHLVHYNRCNPLHCTPDASVTGSVSFDPRQPTFGSATAIRGEGGGVRARPDWRRCPGGIGTSGHGGARLFFLPGRSTLGTHSPALSVVLSRGFGGGSAGEVFADHPAVHLRRARVIPPFVPAHFLLPPGDLPPLAVPPSASPPGRPRDRPRHPSPVGAVMLARVPGPH
jgi:hypothetical protein